MNIINALSVASTCPKGIHTSCFIDKRECDNINDKVVDALKLAHIDPNSIDMYDYWACVEKVEAHLEGQNIAFIWFDHDK